MFVCIKIKSSMLPSKDSPELGWVFRDKVVRKRMNLLMNYE